MNRLNSLIGRKFKNLTAFELMQVIHSYCDDNSYPFDYELDYRTRKDVENYFTSNFYQLFELEDYFKFWTN